MATWVSRVEVPAASTTPAFVNVGDAEIAYHAIGAGPPLLLLHGWPLDGQTFRHLVPALAAHYTCYVIDLPGAGASRWSERTAFDFGSQAERLKIFADSLGLTSYAIFSHDTGGTIGRQLAIIDAARVEKLVAIGTEIPRHRPPWIRLFQVTSYLPGHDFIFRTNLKSPRFLRSARGFGGCFSNLALVDGEFHRCFVQPLLASARLREGQTRRLRGIDWKLLDGLATNTPRFAPACCCSGARTTRCFRLTKRARWYRSSEIVVSSRFRARSSSCTKSAPSRSRTRPYRFCFLERAPCRLSTRASRTRRLPMPNRPAQRARRRTRCSTAARARCCCWLVGSSHRRPSGCAGAYRSMHRHGFRSRLACSRRAPCWLSRYPSRRSRCSFASSAAARFEVIAKASRRSRVSPDASPGPTVIWLKAWLHSRPPCSRRRRRVSAIA